MRQEFAEQLRPYYWKPYFWNRAYGLITTGGRASIETLLKYIQNQDDPLKLRPPLTSESRFPSIRRMRGGVAQTQQIGLLVISHDQHLLSQVCDRLIEL